MTDLPATVCFRSAVHTNADGSWRLDVRVDNLASREMAGRLLEWLCRLIIENAVDTDAMAHPPHRTRQ